MYQPWEPPVLSHSTNFHRYVSHILNLMHTPNGDPKPSPAQSWSWPKAGERRRATFGGRSPQPVLPLTLKSMTPRHGRTDHTAA
ncbi:hypothetical protein EVAR_68808_1 [Eumeta japonica]|uniref:Uncharacterized protein n=1 Tax=Eumeta variegata TaxID=151549 RepID=A0A4C1Z304_EUMVA|nr:hypothetical protein EVAR_68808_1 [Eumeta japonica]